VLNTFGPALDNLRHETQRQQAQLPATALRR
jgi:hypothetical protein